MSNDPDYQLTDSRDTDVARYRALSAPAVAGLLLGLAAPLAMVHPLLWMVPAFGAVVCGWAMRQIARDAPAVCGRRLALAGLALSLVFGVAAPTDWLGYRWLIRREARHFGMAWFEYLGRGEPKKARLLMPDPQFRPPLGDEVEDIFRDDPVWAAELPDYVAKPLIRTLLALGEDARVSYRATTNLPQIQTYSYLTQTYAVRYGDDGQEKTFLVDLTLRRITLPDGKANWQLVYAQSDDLPEGF